MDFAAIWGRLPPRLQKVLIQADATEPIVLSRFVRQDETAAAVLERCYKDADEMPPGDDELELFLNLLGAARRPAVRFREGDLRVTGYELEAKKMRVATETAAAELEAWYANAGRLRGAVPAAPPPKLYVRARSSLRAGGRAGGAQGTAAARDDGLRRRYVNDIVDYLLAVQPPPPAVLAACSAGDARGVLALVAAGRRATTLRTRFRAWMAFVRWLQVAHSLNWPSSWRMMLDYITLRVEEPCGKQTVLGFYYAASFWSKATGTALTADPLWKSAIEELLSRVTARAGRLEGWSAPPPLQRHLQMLEMMVTDADEPRWLRAYAAWKLLQAWGVLRFGDHRGLAPGDISINDGQVIMELRRSKTTGPGKKVDVRRIPIAHDAYLEDSSWLKQGVALLKSLGQEGRDYLLCSPEAGLQAGRARELSYQEAAGWSRLLYQRIAEALGYDARAGELLGRYYTEHSGRSFLPSSAMALGADDDYLRPLGGWGAKVAQAYMKAAVQRTLQIQSQVAARLRRDWGRWDVAGESEHLAKLASYFFDNGLNAEEARTAAALSAVALEPPPNAQTWQFGGDDGQQSEGAASASGSAEAARHVAPKAAAARPRAEEAGAAEDMKGYVISITSKTKFRRLHYVGRCHRHPGVHYQDYEWMGTELPAATEYDDHCRQCWKAGGPPEAPGDARATNVGETLGASDPEQTEDSEDHSSSTEPEVERLVEP